MSSVSFHLISDDVWGHIAHYLDLESRTSFLRTSQKFYLIGSANVADKIAQLMASYAPEHICKITHPLPLTVRIKDLTRAPDLEKAKRYAVGINEEENLLLFKNYYAALHCENSEMIIECESLPNEWHMYLDAAEEPLEFLQTETNSLYALVLNKVKSKIKESDFKAFSSECKNDPLIVLKVLNKAPQFVCKSCLKDIQEELKNDKIFFKNAVKHYASAIQFASVDIRDNLNLARLVIQQDPQAFQHLGAEMQDNEEIVKAAIAKDGTLIAYASERLQNNYEIALMAVQQNTEAFQYIGLDMKNNENIVNIALNANGGL